MYVDILNPETDGLDGFGVFNEAGKCLATYSTESEAYDYISKF